MTSLAPALAEIGIVSALVVAAVAAPRGAQGTELAAEQALAARPAGIPLPELPGIDRPEVPVPPKARRLERDSAFSDRFTAAGQAVEYPFEARAGELSLFELYTAGYARGWTAAAGLKVLDDQGQVLAQRSEEGGVVLRAFLAFVAPKGGEYRLQLSAEEKFFRYALVRHSSYAARGEGELRLPAARERVHGWISDGADRMSFEVELRAGEELALAVEGTREEARAERRSALARGENGAPAGGMRRSMERMGERTAERQFSELRLQIDRQGEVIDRSSTFVRLASDRDGLVVVTVTGLPGERGGLFDLVARRAVEKQRVHGLVVDAADEPCPGVEVAFLLEPDLEPWGRARTDAEGAYALALPAGDYRVVMRPQGEGAEVTVRAGVEGETELNLILPGT